MQTRRVWRELTLQFPSALGSRIASFSSFVLVLWPAPSFSAPVGRWETSDERSLLYLLGNKQQGEKVRGQQVSLEEHLAAKEPLRSWSRNQILDLCTSVWCPEAQPQMDAHAGCKGNSLFTHFLYDHVVFAAPCAAPKWPLISNLFQGQGSVLVVASRLRHG